MVSVGLLCQDLSLRILRKKLSSYVDVMNVRLHSNTKYSRLHTLTLKYKMYRHEDE